MVSPIKELPKNILSIQKYYKYEFTFLNDIFETFDIQPYYNLILSIEKFQLKNLYNFLYIKTIRLNRKFNTKILNNHKYIQSHNEINDSLYHYINQDKVYAFIIINGIQQFFIPNL